ncbi:MAG: hypothetical protein V1882_10140 [Candidatus Omnitrophota bacterium]
MFEQRETLCKCPLERNSFFVMPDLIRHPGFKEMMDSALNDP